MNERIKKLADEAGMTKILNEHASEYGNGVFENTPYPELEKFAELIVRECANHCDLLLDHKISSEWSRGTHDCSRAIKKHFGIEECVSPRE